MGISVPLISLAGGCFSFPLCAFAALRLCVNPLRESLAIAYYAVTRRFVVGRNLVAFGVPPIGNAPPPSAPNSFPNPTQKIAANLLTPQYPNYHVFIRPSCLGARGQPTPRGESPRKERRDEHPAMPVPRVIRRGESLSLRQGSVTGRPSLRQPKFAQVVGSTVWVIKWTEASPMATFTPPG